MMGNITLTNNMEQNYITVSCTFIDEYMHDADGDFVKIYLYLLMLLNSSDVSFSIPDIASKLDVTKNTVTKALNYWDEAGILKLQTEDNNITSIALLPVNSLHKSSEQKASPKPSASKKETTLPVKSVLPEISAAAELKEHSPADIKAIMAIFEKNKGTTLSSRDAENICFLIDDLEFTYEMCEYLIEFCSKSKEHKSINYMIEVAVNWKKEGIDTQSKIYEFVTSRKLTALYNTVAKAFALAKLSDEEEAYVDKWYSIWKFPSDMIHEACSRSRKNCAGFAYADKILSSWHDNNITNLTAVAENDETHRKAVVSVSASKRKASTGYTNFDQRNTDYSSEEKDYVLNYKL